MIGISMTTSPTPCGEEDHAMRLNSPQQMLNLRCGVILLLTDISRSKKNSEPQFQSSFNFVKVIKGLNYDSKYRDSHLSWNMNSKKFHFFRLTDERKPEWEIKADSGKTRSDTETSVLCSSMIINAWEESDQNSELEY